MRLKETGFIDDKYKTSLLYLKHIQLVLLQKSYLFLHVLFMYDWLIYITSCLLVYFNTV